MPFPFAHKVVVSAVLNRQQKHRLAQRKRVVVSESFSSTSAWNSLALATGGVGQRLRSGFDLIGGAPTADMPCATRSGAGAALAGGGAGVSLRQNPPALSFRARTRPTPRRHRRTREFEWLLLIVSSLMSRKPILGTEEAHSRRAGRGPQPWSGER